MEDHVLRKLGRTLLALPVLVLAYAVLLGRGWMARIGVGFVTAAVAAVVVVAGLPPAQSNAVPVSSKPQPVDARVLDAVTTGHGLTKPFTVEFDGPMDPSAVAAALRLRPDTAVTFAWDDAGRVLTISPLSQWQADTLYVLTVSKSARAADGGNAQGTRALCGAHRGCRFREHRRHPSQREARAARHGVPDPARPACHARGRPGGDPDGAGGRWRSSAPAMPRASSCSLPRSRSRSTPPTRSP